MLSHYMTTLRHDLFYARSPGHCTESRDARLPDREHITKPYDLGIVQVFPGGRLKGHAGSYQATYC